MPFLTSIEPGHEIGSPFRGLAWRDWRHNRIVLAPLPFNWVIGAARWLWIAVSTPPVHDKERLYAAGYRSGWNDGFHKAFELGSSVQRDPRTLAPIVPREA